MGTTWGNGPRAILRAIPLKTRHKLVWSVLVLLLLVPGRLTFIQSAPVSAAGAMTSTLITPGQAIGSIRLGMSVREVSAILGPAGPGEKGQLKYPRWGITVSFADGVANRIWTADRRYRTKYGAGVGVSFQDATRLVGDANSSQTPSGGSVTVLYPFQGIGFVFHGDRAVAVFVKQPVALGGPANVLGPARGTSTNPSPPPSGGTAPASGTPSSSSNAPASGSRLSRTGGNMPNASSGVSSGGSGSWSGGSATTSGGGTLIGGTSGLSGGTSGTGSGTSGSGTSGSGGGSSNPLPAIQTVAVDTNGNVVVNGSPFLLIQGTDLDYRSWYASGYSQSQADAKITQMRQNGINTIFGDWYTMDTLWGGGSPTQYADLLIWQRHGLYIHGSATLDDSGQNSSQGIIADYGIPNNSGIVQIVNKFVSRPNLVLWWINNEFNYDPSLPAKYCTGADTVKGADARRTWGDVGVNSMTAAQWEQVLGGCMPVTWVEATIGPFSTGEAVSHLYDGLAVLNQAWNDGTRFVLGFSTTPIPELDPQAVGDPRDCATFYGAMRVPTQAEIHRYFMYQVANNVRAFDILWGPNQRCANVPPGDNLDPAYLSAWNNTLTESSRIRSLAPVILAPGRWQPLATTPAFAAYAPSPTGNDFRGIFAAKKVVGGTTYIVACNMDFVAAATAGSTSIENPINKARINVGFAIKSATRLFESAAVSFSGGVITDAFAPMGVHVYVVTPQ